MAAITINGTDLEATLGADVHDLGATLDGIMGSPAEIEIPTLPGAILVGPHRTRVREFGFRLTLDGADQATVRANLEKLKAIVGDEDVLSTIVLGDQTAKQIEARCITCDVRRYPLTGTANSMNEVPVLVTLGFRAPQPFWEDVTPQSVAFTTSPVAMPQGTAPSVPVLTTAVGAVTTPTITAKDKDGTTLWTCTLASIGASERYRLTTERSVMTIERWNGSAWVSDEDALTAGVFPKPLPASGAGYLGSDWPTLEATAGSWTADYPRRWR